MLGVSGTVGVVAEAHGALRPYVHGVDDHDVVMYLDAIDDAVIGRVTNAVARLADHVGYAELEDVSVEYGSVFRRWRTRVRRALTNEEVSIRLNKLERALEVAGLHAQQAQLVDLPSSQAMQALIVSLDGVPRACVRVGSLLVVKVMVPGDPPVPVVYGRSLSSAEMRIIDRFPEIQRDPDKVFQSLALALSHQEDEPGSQLEGSA